jgi:4-amino-4-deoxy-L-arabinose transferase-like glycosyltransferase
VAQDVTGIGSQPVTRLGDSSPPQTVWERVLPGTSARTRRILLEAVSLLFLLAAAGWIFSIPLHGATSYDEGNYLAALTDLRHGFVLGKDVYPDQPPGWYALLQVLALVVGNSQTAIRIALIAIALLGVVAVWACARRLGRWPAFFAAGLLVVAPPYPLQASQIEGDTSAAVLAVGALACVLWGYRNRGSRALALAAGVLLACGVSIKLSALVMVLPIAVIAFRKPRLVLWSLGGFVAVLAAEVIAYRNELGPIAHGVIGYHVNALASQHWSTRDNVRMLTHYLDWHTPFAWLVAAGVVAMVWLVVRRAREVRILAALWLLVPCGIAFALVLKPLFTHHLVALSVALALPAGASIGVAAARAPRTVGTACAAVAMVFVAAGAYQQHRWADRVPGQPPWIYHAAAWLRAASRPDELVATDMPIVAYDAHRRVVPDLVDSTFTRLYLGELTAKKVFEDIDRNHVNVALIGRVFFADAKIRHAFDAGFRHRLDLENAVGYWGRK